MASSFSTHFVISVTQTFVLTIITEEAFWTIALQYMASKLITGSSIQAQVVSITCAYLVTKLASIAVFANTFSTKNCVVLDPNTSFFRFYYNLNISLDQVRHTKSKVAILKGTWSEIAHTVIFAEVKAVISIEVVRALTSWLSYTSWADVYLILFTIRARRSIIYLVYYKTHLYDWWWFYALINNQLRKNNY